MVSILQPSTLRSITVDGFAVPCLKVSELHGANEGLFNLIVDGRLSVTVEKDELEKWAWFVANAMAVAAGYSSHGANSCVPNPYKVRVLEIRNIEKGDL